MKADLEARRAETLRLIEVIAQPTFGGFSKEPFAMGSLREDLKRSAGDGVVSTLDLLKVADLMAVIGKEASSAHLRANASAADIRKELGAFWAGALKSEPPSAEELAKETANITRQQIRHHREQAKRESRSLAAEVGVLAALHGAIQAQLEAQPGHVSALEFLKDNAEILGVNAAVRDVRHRIEAIQNVDVTPQVKEGVELAKSVARDAVKKAEEALARLRRG